MIDFRSPAHLVLEWNKGFPDLGKTVSRIGISDIFQLILGDMHKLRELLPV